MFQLSFRKWLIWMFLLATALVFVGIVAVSLGAVSIPLSRTVSILLGLGGNLSPPIQASEATILWDLRMPRVGAAMVVGASLALAGSVLQALLRNPLADPFVLGISSGGALGAVLAILFGLGATLLGGYGVAAASFLGALLTLFLVYSIARQEGRVPTATLLLAGVIFSSFFSAIIMFLISITSDERLFDVTFWLMGNVGNIQPRTVGVVFLYLLVGAGVLLGLAKDFNLLSTGEETALALGVEVERTKKIAFICASLITGAVVSVSGLIGFVGLVVPHWVRMIWGPDHRFLLPASAFLGAMLLVLADTVARTIMAPLEIPVGVITAMVGAPFFIYLLRKKGHALYH